MKEAVSRVILEKTNEQSIFDVPYVGDAGTNHSTGHLTRNGKLTKIKRMWLERVVAKLI